MDVTLKTDRIRLRPLGEKDVPALVAGLNDWEVVQYLTMVPHPYGKADAEEWVASRPEPTPDCAHFAIELPGIGMVGSVAVDKELGYWLLPSYQRRGLMTEACAVLLDWHFDSLPDATVASGAHLGNAASLNVQRKLGFVETSRSLRFARSHGRDIEHVETLLTRDAYGSARSALGRPRWM